MRSYGQYCSIARVDHPTIRGKLSAAQWRTTGHIYAWNASETNPPAITAIHGARKRGSKPSSVRALAIETMPSSSAML